MDYLNQPKLLDVQACEDYTLLLTYENGEKRIYDALPLLKFPAWKKLKNLSFFIHMAHVGDFNTVSWDDMTDIAPERLYEDSKLLESATLNA